MKHLLSILTIFSFVFLAKTQSLELYYSDIKCNNADTIHTNVTTNDLHQEFLTVKNVSSATKSVMVKRYDIVKGENVMFGFCWDECYPPATTISPSPIDIAAGDICENFVADFESSDQGVFYVLYTFYDKDNENDSIAIYIEYNCSTNAIAALQKKNIVLNAYPNPAKDNLTINYTIKNSDNTYLRIYTITGNVVYQQTLESGSGKVSLDVSTWATGVYMYSIMENNRNYIAKKLIISK